MTLSRGDVNNTLSEYRLVSQNALNRANVAEREGRCSQAEDERKKERRTGRRGRRKYKNSACGLLIIF